MNTDQDKISYIIGRQIGADFKAQAIEINFETFSQGVRSSYLGEDSELAEDESATIMATFQADMQAAAAKIQGEMGATNLEEGLLFLEENKKREGIEVTASGLQYLKLENGEGKTPGPEDKVEVHYEGTLIDGTVFDSSIKRNETITFPVNGVIPGWTEALQLMKEGDTWELTIPSDIAYGAQGAGGAIGPNAVLNFQVQLIKVL
ncbi:MAG: FKBP-type peptidyl-prolyl cis-trans isomerase [Bacteriovoracaceae bacterium]|jgi:FKBP-type peptidyl-prolyl cis-trans isomerase FklB|nr:FKBP-type peptidyl-prolyl cis-trans isomerase [Bacteriovoracaceae bacterium]